MKCLANTAIADYTIAYNSFLQRSFHRAVQARQACAWNTDNSNNNDNDNSTNRNIHNSYYCYCYCY